MPPQKPSSPPADDGDEPDQGRRRPGTYLLEDVKQLEALVSPLRRKMIGALSAEGPLSATQLADRLGRAPDALYYHLKALIKVGLVVERNTRATKRRPEVLFDLIADHAETPAESEQWDSPWNEPLGKMAENDFRALVKRFKQGLANPDAIKSGNDRDLTTVATDVRLTRDGVRRINGILDEMMRALHEETQKGRGKFYQVGFLMAEIEERNAKKK